MRDIQHDIDSQQDVNMKGSSAVHYFGGLLDSIYGGVDKLANYATLCTIDFSKAYEHVDHTIAIEKSIPTSGTSVPLWFIVPTKQRTIITFLQ